MNKSLLVSSIIILFLLSACSFKSKAFRTLEAQYDALQKESHELKSEKEKSNEMALKIRNELDSLQTEHLKLQAELQTAQMVLSKSKGQIQQLQDQVQRQSEELNRLTKDYQRCLGSKSSPATKSYPQNKMLGD